MCGIAGVLSYSSHPQTSSLITGLTERLAHRGPDHTGYFYDQQIALGHTRLSIIDLSDCAHQPFTDESGRYTLVFNGEIYNYKTLRSQLPDYPYKSSGDTEVILAAWQQSGPACLQQLDGMFAFALWDKNEQTLYLVRDRLGVKPLYYHTGSGRLTFASEIKPFLTTGTVPPLMNPSAAAEFLQYQSVGQTGSILQSVHSVPAGSYLKITADGLHTHPYWQIVNPAWRDNHRPPQLRELLENAVAKRLVSDVPVAALLSGGIDSGVMVGLMTSLSSEKVHTFTLAFREKDFDESADAAVVARQFNTHHEEIPIRAEDFLGQLFPALDAMDTPTGDGVNSFVISRAIASKGIKVALTGAGADELFGGYPIFQQYRQIGRLRWGGPLRHPARWMARTFLPEGFKKDKIIRTLQFQKTGIQSVYPLMRQILTDRMIRTYTTLQPVELKIGNGQPNDLDRFPPMSQVSIAEYQTYSQYTLLKDLDQMSMAHSLEIREPFFDYELIEYVLGLPDHQKRGSYPKQLLVEASGINLPPAILNKKKQGFAIPWSKWMKNELHSFCDHEIKELSDRDFINGPALQNAWRRFLRDDPAVRWMEIWLFVVLHYWLKKNNVR